MVLSISSKREFVPKFNGNDKLPAADQIKVVHRTATIAIKEKLFPKRFEYDQSGDVKGSFEIDRQRTLREFILDIFNLSYKIEDEKEVLVKVNSVESLFKGPPEFDGLIDELYAYFQDMLNRKIDEKN